MANPQKGEQVIEVPDGPSYTIVLNTNAMAEIEAETGVSWSEFMGERVLKQRSVTAVRLLVWGMLRKYHQDVTVEAAGEVLDGIGGVKAAYAIIDAAAKAATPDKKDVQAMGEGATARPRKARPTPTMNGAGSSAPLAVSA